MRPPLMFLLIRFVLGAIILPQKQYDSLHHDPVYSRISTATSFGGEYEPSPRHHLPSYHHPSIFLNPFLKLHSPFGGCDCAEREQREEEYDRKLPRRREEDDDLWERDRGETPKEEPRQYVAKIREIPTHSSDERDHYERDHFRSAPAFTYLGPAD
ncbi:hypothetical protein PRIPAC_73787 [Pristionchus pacificus]|uniref:Uncharacterized protein n=1 Tax=Pristionchus pacificus TaxID=54126 RepID=A0A2A6C0S3_PRIPA|nr:hypothetical protein PRIPAC_73787 [Pristionchus pacificus]|eukprot:PDM71765.1 hypothetical protein PRIPAC_38172 [Pristionchus pacificus]